MSNFRMYHFLFLFFISISTTLKAQDKIEMWIGSKGVPGEGIEILEYKSAINGPTPNFDGSSSGKNYATDVEVTKIVDESSLQLIQLMVETSRIQEINISFMHFEEINGWYEYYNLKLEEVFITLIETQTGDDIGVDNYELIKLSASKYNWEYQFENGIYSYGWDFHTNSEFSNISNSLAKETNTELDTIKVGNVFLDGINSQLPNPTIIWDFEQRNMSIVDCSGPACSSGDIKILEFNFTKKLDQFQPLIVQHLLNGTELNSAEIILYKEGVEYFKYRLDNVLITLDSVSSSKDFYVGDIGVLNRETVSLVAQRWQWENLETHQVFEYALTDNDWAQLFKTNNETTIVNKIELSNYPNPFNGTTNIQFNIPPKYLDQQAKVSIYNITGELVKTVFNGQLVSTNNSAQWNGTNNFNVTVPSGNYFYRLTAGDLTKTGKLTYMK